MSNGNVRDQAEANIRRMIAADPDFRRALLEDPTGTLGELFGGRFPEDVNVHVHEETPNDVHLVVPAVGAGRDADAAGGVQPHSYCSHPGGGSWSSCGYELTCYGPTCNSS